jgi:molecular chaperone GrpE
MTKKTHTKDSELLTTIDELTADLQRTRADFENYRRRVEGDLVHAKTAGEQKTIAKLLPILDDVDRTIANIPTEIAETDFAKGLNAIAKNLTKIEGEFGLEKIVAKSGNEFNPDIHHAVSIDESDGEYEIIAEQLQNGWTLNGVILRPAMVRVTRK